MVGKSLLSWGPRYNFTCTSQNQVEMLSLSPFLFHTVLSLENKTTQHAPLLQVCPVKEEDIWSGQAFQTPAPGAVLGSTIILQMVMGPSSCSNHWLSNLWYLRAQCGSIQRTSGHLLLLPCGLSCSSMDLAMQKCVIRFTNSIYFSFSVQIPSWWNHTKIHPDLEPNRHDFYQVWYASSWPFHAEKPLRQGKWRPWGANRAPWCSFVLVIILF